jgi:radical SAM superfamily enzyme YgiQ (UPF0313 family)
MQPIAGLQVGSQIDPARFDVELYHEDWHGPYDVARADRYDLVFLTGLQPDFDRMRQLSYHFRQQGAVVVAGGSICTMFPEFASRFFDVVCAGGVDSVPAVVADYLGGSLKPVYRSPVRHISSYGVDYSLFTRSGISPSVHLVESSRGCSFKCSFCSIPTEVGGHSSYVVEDVSRAIDNSLRTSPRFSFRRLHPLILFLDNNFADDRQALRRITAMVGQDRRIRGWAALVTQDVLQDRQLVAELAATKCIGLFVGLESIDRALLKRFNKKQNLSKRSDVFADVAFAESLGIAVTYGYLFDPRHQTARQMKEQLLAISRDSRMPMPVYLSVVAPLAGTASFWEDLAERRLAGHLRLRDLDGETLAYSELADDPDVLVDFIERVFRRPWTVVSRTRILAKTLARIVRARTLDPVRWYAIAAANLHCFVWSRSAVSAPRTYRAGTDTLDPQYSEVSGPLSEGDRARYFDPILVTDADGGPAEWLKPYLDEHLRSKRRRAVETA